jgi:hypothetical protein
LLLILALGTCFESNAHGQAYIFAGENPNVVTHPIGYDGTGGVLTVTVGIDPSSENADEMMISTQNAIRTWNGLIATTGNIEFGNIAVNEIDFESVLIHEMGHSLGLAHVNLATESGLNSSLQDYSKSGIGENNQFDLNAGLDGVIGSADDIRGDDVNLNFFERGVNNPFALNADGIFDSTTYTTDVADLPDGDTFVANADRDVSALFGVANTEGVMQQGSFFGETQRSLAASDVIGIRYAESGIDELQGTADDYDLNIVFSGQTTSADIVIDFDNNRTGFAVSSSGGTLLTDTHVAITSNNIFFNTGFNWHFNDVLAVPEPASAILLTAFALSMVVRRRR